MMFADGTADAEATTPEFAGGEEGAGDVGSGGKVPGEVEEDPGMDAEGPD